jgi:hypothetical protein
VAKLVLFLADGTTLDVALDRDHVYIGRRTGNEVCLPYPAVSGKHAMVVTLPTGSVVEDLGSTNGTFVNGKRIDKYFLHDRDTIDIGRQRLVYCVDDNATVAASPLLRSLRSDDVGTGRTAAGSLADRVATALAGEAAVHNNTTVRLGAITITEAAIAEYADRAASKMDVDFGEAPRDGMDSPSSGPAIRVLTGPNAGRVLALDKEEVLLGRIGVQVAAVRNTRNGFLLSLVEGATPPEVNGVAVPEAGAMLAAGDVAEIAGARVEFAELESPHTQKAATNC